MKITTFDRREIAVIVSTILLIVGAWVSHHYCDWTLLERFGGLITIVGIVSFSFGLETDVRAAADRYTDAKLRLLVKRATTSDADLMQKWTDVTAVAAEDNSDLVRPVVNYQNKKIEVAILLVGTAIWAWGSFLPKAVVLLGISDVQSILCAHKIATQIPTQF